MLCLLLLLFILSAWSPAIAQQRPLLTEDPRTIPTGRIVTEGGVTYLHRARFPVSGLGGDQLSLFVNGLHAGLGPQAEFQITGVAHNLLRVRENGTGWRNDWGDFALSTKIKLIEETRLRPVVTFRPTVILPNTNNDKGLGTDGTHFFAALLFGKTFGGSFIYGSLGLGILDDAVRPAAQQDVLSYGIAAIVPLTSRLSLLGEWSGLENPQDNPTAGGEDRGQIRLGTQFRAGGVRWDLGATAGLTRYDHKAGFVAGFTKEFQLWK